MKTPELTADCANCADLCCLALAFDRSEQFAIDKPAGTPCQHLAQSGGCTIHENLPERGFPGCARYTCFGAGPWLTQTVFAGQNWRQDPDLQRQMTDQFRNACYVFTTLSMLQAAKNLPLTDSQKDQLAHLWFDFQPERIWARHHNQHIENTPIAQDAAAFFRSLKSAVADPPAN